MSAEPKNPTAAHHGGPRPAGELRAEDDRGNRLRLARLARRISQDQLAQQARVSRQSIAGIESGRWDPSLRVAISIARALGVTVEEIFGDAEAPEPVLATIVDADEDPPSTALAPCSQDPPDATISGGLSWTMTGRFALGRVGPKTVGFSLRRSHAVASGFLPASAIPSSQPSLSGGADGDTPRLLSPFAPIPSTLVIAGCDPATALLGPLLERSSPSVDLLWWPCSSSRALSLLRAGLVHAAGIHLADPASGTYNRKAARAALASLGAEILGFTTWREGIVVAPHHAKQVKGVGDIARLGLSVIHREPGSEARALFERELSSAGLDLEAFGRPCAQAPGHLEVAAAVAWGLVDAGIASEPAALVYEMAFVPLATERYDLVVASSSIGSVEVQALLRALGSSWLTEQIGSLRGYDATECGRIVDSF